MRGRWRRALPTLSAASLGLGLGLAGLALPSCNDFLTGQDPIPDGPLQITRVTLLDRGSRREAVFTDTLAPLDCEQPPYRESRGCQNDPLRDRYGKQKSPPTPDSGGEIRVVFNKLPLLYDGKDVEPALKGDSAVVGLTCEGCGGVPALSRRLILIGSDLAADPLTSPYGPALLMKVDTGADPVAALEPDTRYRVTIGAALSGRDGQRVALTDSARLDPLLTFTTEPFKVLQVGTGASGDPWVYPAGQPAGTSDSPFRVAALANDGVVVLRLNAPIDLSTVQGGVSATLTPEGGAATPVPVGVGLSRRSGTECAEGAARFLYLWADTADRRWGAGKGELRLSLKKIGDRTQAAGHPAGQGKHALGDRVVVATLTGAAAATGALVFDGACPAAKPAPMPMPDMAGALDMAPPSDGGRD